VPVRPERMGEPGETVGPNQPTLDSGLVWTDDWGCVKTNTVQMCLHHRASVRVQEQAKTTRDIPGFR